MGALHRRASIFSRVPSCRGAAPTATITAPPGSAAFGAALAAANLDGTLADEALIGDPGALLGTQTGVGNAHPLHIRVGDQDLHRAVARADRPRRDRGRGLRFGGRRAAVLRDGSLRRAAAPAAGRRASQGLHLLHAGADGPAHEVAAPAPLRPLRDPARARACGSPELSGHACGSGRTESTR